MNIYHIYTVSDSIEYGKKTKSLLGTTKEVNAIDLLVSYLIETRHTPHHTQTIFMDVWNKESVIFSIRQMVTEKRHYVLSSKFSCTTFHESLTLDVSRIMQGINAGIMNSSLMNFEN